MLHVTAVCVSSKLGLTLTPSLQQGILPLERVELLVAVTSHGVFASQL